MANTPPSSIRSPRPTPYNLYDSEASGRGVGGQPGVIQRTGSPGSYGYAVVPLNGDTVANEVNLPMNFVAWGDACRYCNWLQNGQAATGMENAGTTEQGAYLSNGASERCRPGCGLVGTQSTHQYFLPAQDEWYKAAYYKTGGTNAGYWLYPNCSNTPPVNTLSASGTNNANFFNGSAYTNTNSAFWAGGTTPVGSFAKSPGPYGTFDMVGNVTQWCESGDAPDNGYYADNRVTMGGRVSCNWVEPALGSAAGTVRHWARLQHRRQLPGLLGRQH